MHTNQRNSEPDDRPADAPAAAGLPEPHTCPYWIHYLLASPLRRLAEPPAKLVGSLVEPGMTVVDVGCGFGYLSLPLAQMVGPGGRVVSVDCEPRAVDRMVRRARKRGLADRIDGRACRPRDLGLTDYAGAVDLIAVIHTLHELEDLHGFLRQARELLKPGGRLLVVEPRGHVKPEAFAAEIDVCRGHDFRELDPPALGRKRMVALFASPG